MSKQMWGTAGGFEADIALLNFIDEQLFRLQELER